MFDVSHADDTSTPENEVIHAALDYGFGVPGTAGYVSPVASALMDRDSGDR